MGLFGVYRNDSQTSKKKTLVQLHGAKSQVYFEAAQQISNNICVYDGWTAQKTETKTASDGLAQ